MRLPGHLRRARGGDIAVDLGTANTVVFVRGHGIALFEPSVVAVDETTGQVLAVGEEARRMIGRTPATIRATRPLRHGVIADFEVTESMLRHFIRRTIGTGRRHPRVILCVPSGITEVERRAVEEATLVAGAREARLIEEPMAAAIGADLPVAEPRASMIVDIGGGTTEVAVISLGGMVVWESIRVGGYEMDEAIVDHVKKQYGLLIGQERAEEAKIAIGSAGGSDELREAEVAGRDMISGLLRRLPVASDEVRLALEGPISRIVDAVKDTLERTPPELSADVVERGIVLAGGGALLHGMSERLRAETGLPVHVVDSPLTCVAVGAGRSLEEFEAISRASAGRPLRRGL
ncbi:MAG TPA: rod shape-determining protein [Gaiellaceae bacterium]|jgi:rod shape-determining protein MreB|nr:rod shape-determining protein [Gaiellaceae bacterium]